MSAATGPRTLKEKQREEREQLIVRAAEDLLVEKGYHETSIDEIAASVGIAKGTVYLHFSSKEDLVFAMFEQHLRQFRQTIETIVLSPTSPRARLHAILETVYGGMFSKRMQLLAAVYQSPELRARFAERRSAKTELWDEMARRVSGVLEEGKAAGDFDPQLPTPVMVSIFFSLLTPHGYARLVAQEHMPVDDMVAHLSQVFFKGIAASAPREGTTEQA